MLKKYFYLQLKRSFKLFPFILVVTLLLLLGTAIAIGGMISGSANKTENKKLNIGVTGDMDNSLLRLGLGAFKAIDDTQFSIELLEYNEDAAAKDLKKGDISAYIVVPEEFVEKALHGEVEPIRFVTTAESSDIVTMLKNEVLTLIADMVIDCQKGTYGAGDAVATTDDRSNVGKVQSEISLEYFELIMDRGKLLEVEELGVANKLSTANYYICSIFIVFMMLMGLPFANLYCSGDNSLAAVLKSKGVSSLKLLCGEFFAHTISLLAVLAVIFGGITAFSLLTDANIFKETFGCPFLIVLPTVIMFAAFNVMVFEVSSNIISGLLSHFFLSLSLMFISGCFFPIHSFPKAVQSVANILPVCVVREQLSCIFTGENSLLSTLLILGFTVLFMSVALLAKRVKLYTGKAGTV